MHDALAYHSGGDDSDNAIGTIFSDEINHVLNVFFRERFSCRYIRLVKRDFDRFARLISAPAFNGSKLLSYPPGGALCPGRAPYM